MIAKNYIGIDVETFSSVDLKTDGLYNYVQSPDFEILLFGCKRNRNEKEQYDFACGEKLPKEIFDILISPDWVKTSHNAAFEIETIETHFGIKLFKEQWECTMVKGAMLGFPLSLDALAKALRLPLEKNKAGKGLIDMFSKPCKPTKINGHKTRMLPSDNMPKWIKYKSYNMDDVEVEDLAKIELDKYQYEISDFEKEVWRLDQKINARGVYLDIDLINNAIDIDRNNREVLSNEAIDLSGIPNPNSPDQLKAWLEKETGEEVPKLRKEDVTLMLEKSNSTLVTRLLKLRQELSKTSIKKYSALLRFRGFDGRARGMLQYYGANRTGRFAGRGPQIHNFPKNVMSLLGHARDMILSKSTAIIDLIFESLSYVLSQCLRTALVASPGCILGVSDYAAIEARVIAYLAGEKWRMEVFAGDGKIYEASASKMFNIPIEQVTKTSDYRARGKVSELALGFGGSVDALIRMGALLMGVKLEELAGLVKRWRVANPKIVAYWDNVNAAAIRCVENPGMSVSVGKGVSFKTTGDIMYITLPSGRKLSYVRPRIAPNRWGYDGIVYEGMNQVSKIWCKHETYGGKLVENIVQAIARDILATALLRIDKAGYDIVFHVHDEVVVDLPLSTMFVDSNGKLDIKSKLNDINRLMEIPMEWAPTLPLKAEGFTSSYYKKD